MKAKIFSFVRMSDNSMVASVRIARFVSDTLGIPVVDDETIGDEPLDLLVVVNGAFAFCKCLPALGQAILGARRLVWIQNDYTIIIPKAESGAESPFRRAFRDRRSSGKPDADFWTTCEDNMTATKMSRYVNWNCLTFDDQREAAIKKRRAGAAPDLFYYGSFRVGRRKNFDRYFLAPRVPVTISSPSKKFSEIYRSGVVKHESKVDDDFYETIGQHGMGLYLEDRASHSSFHSPSNRLYEMFSAGLPILFQPECGSMLRRAGYDPSPWQASSPLEVLRVFERREEIGAAQREAWLTQMRREHAILSGVLVAAYNSARDAL